MSTIDQQISELNREQNMRKRVYPKLIKKQTLSKDEANRRYNVMNDIIKSLTELKDLKFGKQNQLFKDNEE